MKLLTREIKTRLGKYPLYSQDGKGRDMMCLAKFFLCMGAWTWYICEADFKRDTWFGVVINGQGEGEFGYGTFHELQTLRGLGGCLPVERDIMFEPTTLGEINDGFLKKFLDKLYSPVEKSI